MLFMNFLLPILTLLSDDRIDLTKYSVQHHGIVNHLVAEIIKPISTTRLKSLFVTFRDEAGTRIPPKGVSFQYIGIRL